VGENNGMNYKKVMRYIRLNYLTPELLDKVDDKKMGFMPAVELSYIKPKNQQLIAVSIEGEQASPSVAQAKKLREYDLKNHPNYKYTAEADKKRNAFDLSRLITRRMDGLDSQEEYAVYEVDGLELTAEDEEILSCWALLR